MRRQSWLALALVLAGVVATFLGVRHWGSKDHADLGLGVDGGEVVLPPAVPAQLLAELVVATPNASWSRLQRGIGGAAGILPTTLPGVVVALTGLDPRLSSELDGSSPMYGVVAGAPVDPSTLLAIHLVDVRKTRTVLGVDAGSGGSMTMLPARRGADTMAALTASGWLLVGRRASDFDLAPWLTRPRAVPPNVAPAEAITIDVPKSGVAAVLPLIASAWNDGRRYLLAEDSRMRAQRGRAPDYGDPAAIVSVLDGWVDRKLAILGDLDGIHVVVEPTDDALDALATLLPSKEGPSHAWLAPMLVGDATPVLALPSSSVVAFSTRDAEGARQDQAVGLEQSLETALGPRLKDPTLLHDAVKEATAARGDVVAVAVDEAGALLRAPVRDVAAARRAIRGTLDLLQTDPWREALRIRSVNVGEGTAKIVRGAAHADAGAPTEAKVAWSVADTLTLAYGAPARAATLADEPKLAHFTGAIGSDASSILVAQPGPLLGARAAGFAPVAAALGKKAGAGFLRLEIADVVVRELVRSQMGL